jgi:endogenous inhibitor of DNA gyrase (YacG/DUF329 family)
MATTVACPVCRRPSRFDASNRWRPFCSERCKVIDLGAWAAEQYRIGGRDEAPDDEPPDTSVAPERPRSD